jgi:hypothetical protein
MYFPHVNIVACFVFSIVPLILGFLIVSILSVLIFLSSARFWDFTQCRMVVSC